jgi:hypothetical protein
VTWVIGAHAIGGAIFVSDVRVSYGQVPFTGGGIQKLHHVGGRILAGFAGSVECGFAAISCLRRAVTRLGPRSGFNLRAMLAHGLGRALRPISLWRPGANLEVLLGFTDGRHRMGPIRGWAWVYTLRAPRFEPLLVIGTASIGSGTAAYSHQLEHSLTVNGMFGRGDDLGRIAIQAAMYMGTVAEIHADATVGPNMFAGACTADTWAIQPVLLTSPAGPIPFPPTAATWDEWVAMSGAAGLPAAAATA